jgi:hypothetical protein
MLAYGIVYIAVKYICEVPNRIWTISYKVFSLVFRCTYNRKDTNNTCKKILLEYGQFHMQYKH